MYTLKMRMIMLAAAFMALPVFSQSAFKGQLHIGNESFALQGTLLRVKLHVSYNDNLLNRGESLHFTPMLKNGYNHQALSSVVIMGKGADTTRLRANIPVVLRDQFFKGRRGFEYDTTIPYQPWMDGASFYIESDERTKKGKSHIYEDLIFDKLRIGRDPASTAEIAVPAKLASTSTPSYNPLEPATTTNNVYYNPSTVRGAYTTPQAVPEWVQIIEPTQPVDDEMIVRGIIPLADNREIGSMNTRRFNETVYRELRNALREKLSVSGTTINTLSLTGYGAPIGNYRQNETRCAARALELKSYILGREGEAPNSVNVSWVAEDWDSIRSLISNSTVRLRDAALDIIRSVDIASGREEQLRMLGGGSLYSNLTNTVFPQVCRIEYVASLRREAVGSSIKSEKAISLHSMYETATKFAKGSREFNDLIDLSARLYPNYAEACINAAGVALMRGDLNSAANYLKGYETDPRAYNNIGILHLLQGDTSKAEVYLMMAQAAGVTEATQVLSAIRY